ncbi:hypothetical protein BOTBODRAFT_410933 [Botryobasidium botryosum FD-172 SS1]|uniref:Major facilitator superfamily (MFS) profile domain-containing protein n=1 Tax=Botryobasidium botryosum (strain FD-172 SS1) TaxID=930990 RepID=A0A067MLR1_BOTB1|nr:hypothetical protein BOTBODRAFT_410933 [Botryobasidium botryosum FD-172 SS1]
MAVETGTAILSGAHWEESTAYTYESASLPIPSALRDRRPSSNISPESRIRGHQESRQARPAVSQDENEKNNAVIGDDTIYPTPSISLPVQPRFEGTAELTPPPFLPITPGSELAREQYLEDSFPLAAPLIEPVPPERVKRRLCSAFAAFFCCGWGDGTPGTILPYIEHDLHLSYLTVSLLFVAACVGFFIGTIVIEPLVLFLGRFPLSSNRSHLIPYLLPLSRVSKSGTNAIGYSLSQGRFWVMVIAGLLQVAYFGIAVSKPPFAGLLVAFCLGGIATSMFMGQLNAYVACMPAPGRALGNLHGFYGIGACASPLVCQTLLAHGWKWNKFYWISFALGLSNLLLTVAVFPTTRGEFASDKGRAAAAANAQIDFHSDDVQIGGTSEKEADLEKAKESPPLSRHASTGAMPKSTMRMAVSLPYVWVFAIFLFIYTGTETSTGGWIVTFLLRDRGANPNTVGYVATGFWAGLALGRIISGYVSPYMGMRIEKHLVHVYILIAGIMQLLVWFIPSFIANSVCTAIVGLVLGPMFPTSLTLATKLLPQEVHMTALATMSSFASMGSALFPFLTGVLANAKGPYVLQPMLLGMFCVMGCLWFVFPVRIHASP